eukprot:2496935-Amphidinium_carterae.1
MCRGLSAGTRAKARSTRSNAPRRQSPALKLKVSVLDKHVRNAGSVESPVSAFRKNRKRNRNSP